MLKNILLIVIITITLIKIVDYISFNHETQKQLNAIEQQAEKCANDLQFNKNLICD